MSLLHVYTKTNMYIQIHIKDQARGHHERRLYYMYTKKQTLIYKYISKTRREAIMSDVSITCIQKKLHLYTNMYQRSGERPS